MKNFLKKKYAGIAVVLSLFLWQGSAAAGCAPNPLVFDPRSPAFLTSDTIFEFTQQGANCYAWQMFIALNWPVASEWPQMPEKAGEPDRTFPKEKWGIPPAAGQAMTRDTVWSSFKQASDIFLPNAATPSGWGVIDDIGDACQKEQQINVPGGFTQLLKTVTKSGVSGRQQIHTSSKRTATHSDEIMEAFGGWLTDQSGKLVFFERLVGKAEFDFIMDHKLYDAVYQKKLAMNENGQHPAGFSLPIGDYIRGVPAQIQKQAVLGAIEVKAGWRILTDHPEVTQRFLTTDAFLYNPDTKTCKKEIVGLVALHIIHKTSHFPDFVWATFEQIDNVPGSGSDGPYSFHNPDCPKDKKECQPNQARIDCTGASCKDLFPKDQPVQVTRVNPTPDNLEQLNRDVQQQIADFTNQKSVFQYYKLVNVMWDQSPSPPENAPGVGAKIPLSYGSFQSEGNLPTANTVLETYVQQKTCLACHKNATIAGSKTLASDFSFLFEAADSSQ